MALRQAFTAELEQLRLQVELLAVRVDENLDRMRLVLEAGDAGVAAHALAADDGIDAAVVSLTERCYDLLCRETPVASDLRFIVSVLRVLEELERIGDLALRVVKLAPEQHLLAAERSIHDILRAMADEAIGRYRAVLRAWAAQDLDLAVELAETPPEMDVLQDRLSRDILALDGDDAVATAVRAFYAGRSLERIADHTRIITARLRYLLTGDATHIASEVR